MRIRLVTTLKGGERLAESVITDEKETLISRGTILKPEYLDLLLFLGIETVCIEDPFESEEMPHRIISKEKVLDYIQRVQKILENHIYKDMNSTEKSSLEKLISLSQEIVEELIQVDEDIVIDVEESNGNLYEHTIKVTMLTVMVARKLKVPKESLYEMALGCLLHDLGLRYITVSYINQDMEKVSSSESFEYKKHTIQAYSVLEGESWISPCAKKMILSHHERRDGSGFPLRQKSRELECNILQACDAFECAISGVECKRVGVQQALENMMETADVLFDKKIVKTLVKLVGRYPVGTKVRLTSGELGIVVSQTDNSIRPVIGVLDEDEQLTEVRHNLSKSKKISILQVEE